MILTVLSYIGVAFGGAIAASFAEYKLKYNLFDLLKDKIFALFGKKSA